MTRHSVQAHQTIKRLRNLSSKDPIEMAKVRLVPQENVLGVSMVDIRKLATDFENDLGLAESLWVSNFIEAKALAVLILPIALYEKRAGLALLANIRLRTREFPSEVSAQILNVITDTSSDDRHHVRKACCWALREFGKSNALSRSDAISLAHRLSEKEAKAEAWVGRCALRELKYLDKIAKQRGLKLRLSSATRAT